jgi:Fe/S biogenesis protein NfuA
MTRTGETAHEGWRQPLKRPLGFWQRKSREEPSRSQVPLVRITDAATSAILEIRARDSEPERLALWVEITGNQGPEYTYDMYLLPLDEASEEDAVVAHDDLPIVVTASSIDKVRGATIDFQGDLYSGGGLMLDNPNKAGPPLGMLPIMPSAPASPAVGTAPPADLSGDVAERVAQVLEGTINPQIAAHGGRADLVAVEGDVAYLRLSGGCQGCGMATVTLSQGIEVAITGAVPEISHVVDVTDHASGTNPYFEASKK